MTSDELRKLADPIRHEMISLLNQTVSFPSVISRGVKRVQEGQLPKIAQQALCTLPVKYMIVRGPLQSEPETFLKQYLQGSPRIDELAWACIEAPFELVDVFRVIVNDHAADTWVSLLEDRGLGATLERIRRLADE